MKKYTFIFISILVVASGNYPNLATADAQTGCELLGVSTVPGNIENHLRCDCSSAEPVNISSAQTISAEGSIAVDVSGGCPPYTYVVSGNGASWGNDSQSVTTNNTSALLSVEGGTCDVHYSPVLTITVADNCGGFEETIKIRVNGGEDTGFGSNITDCSSYPHPSHSIVTHSIIIDDSKYWLVIGLGNELAWHPSPGSCSELNRCPSGDDEYKCNQSLDIEAYLAVYVDYFGAGPYCCAADESGLYCNINWVPCGYPTHGVDIVDAYKQIWECR